MNTNYEEREDGIPLKDGHIDMKLWQKELEEKQK